MDPLTGSGTDTGRGAGADSGRTFTSARRMGQPDDGRTVGVRDAALDGPVLDNEDQRQQAGLLPGHGVPEDLRALPRLAEGTPPSKIRDRGQGRKGSPPVRHCAVCRCRR
jgi:hypothetical protein